ncbi:VOC family protein [Sedimentitalea todarodis]|uniref:VOC family protein n=1 Tax=Sedimentitalea todarodis TaxID=1631240 RepID=A0ABU3VCN0_9RHOB|nr:VOC family protein [Sedimentitalea todarodis]MDU9003838.1 VOC family protein [Sedimentitalea todarodis]
MTNLPENALVWAEIPVSDLDKAIAFYTTVTGGSLNRTETGPNPIADFQTLDNGVALHLYPGKPAEDGRGPTLHLASAGTLEETMNRVTDAGGKVLSPIIDIPPGRFFYATDPDGNSIGFFKMRS